MVRTPKQIPSNGSPKPRFGKDQPKHYCGKKGKSGPPTGNVNGIRHGLKAGKLPRDCKYLEHRLLAFRRTLEAAVLAARKEVALTDAGIIQTAVRWERHACLAQRWLTKMQDELKPEQRLTFSREIARASSERDKALQALRLDHDAADDAIAALYARPALTNEPINQGGDDEAS